MAMLLGLVVVGLAGSSMAQDVALCGSLSRDLATCLMGAQASAPKDAQQEAAEAAVLECSQYKGKDGDFLVGAPCRDAVQAINARILCMDRGFADDAFQSDMLDCIGNSTLDAVAAAQAPQTKRRTEPQQGTAGWPQGMPQNMGQNMGRGPMGGRGMGQGGPPQQGPSEMADCMSDRSFQTCMRSDVAKKHFERGFRSARQQQRPQSPPCEAEQRRLLEAGCPAQPLPQTLCPCKCELVEALKVSCGFPEPPADFCPKMCSAAAAHQAGSQGMPQGMQQGRPQQRMRPQPNARQGFRQTP